uniref:G-protein coupled receptors family 1 profile domain-containing protein n=1 Tax=Plectus sambesii TaxID=2011161 RepID=A0A914W931_9BILA
MGSGGNEREGKTTQRLSSDLIWSDARKSAHRLNWRQSCVAPRKPLAQKEANTNAASGYQLAALPATIHFVLSPTAFVDRREHEQGRTLWLTTRKVNSTLEASDNNTCELVNGSSLLRTEVASAVTSLQLTIKEVAFIIPLPFAVFGFLINALFIGAVVTGLRKRQLGKKLYAFLLCRAVADLLSSVVMVGLGLAEIFAFLSVTDCVALLMLCEFSFWTSAFANLSLSLLKLVAVKRPLWYRAKFTKKVCTTVIVTFVLIATACALFQCLLQKTVLNMRAPHLRPLCYSAQTCLHLLLGWWIFVTGGVYACVLGCSLFTYYLVKQRTHETGPVTLSLRPSRSFNNASACSNGGGGASANAARYWKLGLNIVVYAIGNALEIPGGAVGIYYSPLFYLGDYTIPCNYESLNEVSRLRFAFYFVELSHVMFNLRICCDPIANFIIDPSLRKALWSHWPKWRSSRNSGAASNRLQPDWL